MNTWFAFCAVVTAVSAYTSAAFSIVNMRAVTYSPIASHYAAARSVPLAVVSLVPFFNGSTMWLAAMATVMILIQSLDAFIGFEQRDNAKTFGPVCLAALNLIALALMLREA